MYAVEGSKSCISQPLAARGLLRATSDDDERTHFATRTACRRGRLRIGYKIV